MGFLNLFEKTTKDGVDLGATVTITDLRSMVEPVVAERVIDILVARISDNMFEEMYPEIEKRLEDQLPKVAEDFTDEVLVNIRKKVYGAKDES